MTSKKKNLDLFGRSFYLSVTLLTSFKSHLHKELSNGLLETSLYDFDIPRNELENTVVLSFFTK